MSIGKFHINKSNNCASHQSNTRHIEEKYLLYAKTLRQAILLKYPIIRVYCKPISTNLEGFIQMIKFNKEKSAENVYRIENYRPEMRLGAFEVQLYKKAKGEIITEFLHSKLNTRIWPSINAIINKIGSTFFIYRKIRSSYKY